MAIRFLLFVLVFVALTISSTLLFAFIGNLITTIKLNKKLKEFDYQNGKDKE